MKKEWISNNIDLKGLSLTQKLLYSRGIKTEEDVRIFLNPLEMPLTSPDAFCDMPKAVERLSKAIDNKETIVIYGDFDADGVTSTSVLYKTFKHLGAQVHYFIPNRETQGHGFDTKALVQLMTTVKPKVLISVDCGISNVKEVSFVNSFKNCDVIITDHHEAPEILPDAYAIINPKAQNSLDENLSAKQIEHLTYLAGCGVAFKVAQALLSKYDKTDFIYEILPFVAVGTIADIVPLLGENRYYVTKGLDLISKGKHEGLKLLLESAKYDISKGVTSENIAFGVAPRINASGRLDTVDYAIKLLISDSLPEIKLAIENLNELNRVRQTLCSDTFEQADEMYQKDDPKKPAIILYNENWHIGIIGIVASKFVEKYYKPTFLMTKENGIFRCSARSIEGVPLYDVISENSELLDGFGGHSLAAGLSFSEEKSSFEAVKNALNETVSGYVNSAELKPFIKIDLNLQPQDITLDFTEKLSELEPFGASNPNPIFETDSLTVEQKRTMGNDNSHLRLNLSKDGYDFTAVWWGVGDLPLEKGDKIDIAFHPQKNEFNGSTTVQLIIDDIHSEKLDKISNSDQNNKYKIYDNRFKTDILNDVNDYLKNSKLDIKVFAESKPVTDSLQYYPSISSRIFTRKNIPQCDVVMFFDYPADRQTFENIINTSSPKALHFMNFVPKIYDEESLIKTFSGMIKYASHNNNGEIDLVRCASFLGKSVEVIKQLLELFEEFGYIEIKNKNEDFYFTEYNDNNDLKKIIESEKYAAIFDMAQECDIFRQSLLQDDLEQTVYNR